MNQQLHSGLSIRKATLNDIYIIRDIAYTTWPIAYASILSKEALYYMLQHFYSVEALEKQFNDGHSFFIAEHHNDPVGFAGISEIKPSVYKLHKLYVLPGVQKTGAGKALILHCVEISRAAGATELILNVNRFNPAKGFYEKMGFKVIAEEDVDIGNGVVQEDYIMQLRLGAKQ